MFSDEVQAELAGISSGIRARCKFLPTVADVMELGNEIAKRVARNADFERRFSGRRVEYLPSSGKTITGTKFFPALTAALGGDADTLLSTPGISFDQISNAALLHRTRGVDGARGFLMAIRGEYDDKESKKRAVKRQGEIA